MRPAAAARPDGQTVRELDNLRVLVVEDHAELARMFATLLRSQGCNVTIAEKGATAVVLGSLFQPEVVLLDIRLPDIDGYEVARQLIEKVQPRPRIIAVSAYSQDRYREQALSCGIDVYLAKPVGSADLLRHIMQSPPGN
jgi:CheY-like chemotaxis protein